MIFYSYHYYNWKSVLFWATSIKQDARSINMPPVNTKWE